MGCCGDDHDHHRDRRYEKRMKMMHMASMARTRKVFCFCGTQPTVSVLLFLLPGHSWVQVVFTCAARTDTASTDTKRNTRRMVKRYCHTCCPALLQQQCQATVTQYHRLANPHGLSLSLAPSLPLSLSPSTYHTSAFTSCVRVCVASVARFNPFSSQKPRSGSTRARAVVRVRCERPCVSSDTGGVRRVPLAL